MIRREEIIALARLKEVLLLLTDEKRWTKGLFARTIGGIRCEAEYEKAYSFCLSGAIRKVMLRQLNYSWDDFSITTNALLRNLFLNGKQQLVAVFNDLPGTKHADVIALIESSILDCESRLKEEQVI